MWEPGLARRANGAAAGRQGQGPGVRPRCVGKAPRLLARRPGSRRQRGDCGETHRETATGPQTDGTWTETAKSLCLCLYSALSGAWRPADKPPSRASFSAPPPVYFSPPLDPWPVITIEEGERGEDPAMYEQVQSVYRCTCSTCRRGFLFRRSSFGLGLSILAVFAGPFSSSHTPLLSTLLHPPPQNG